MSAEPRLLNAYQMRLLHSDDTCCGSRAVDHETLLAPQSPGSCRPSLGINAPPRKLAPATAGARTQVMAIRSSRVGQDVIARWPHEGMCIETQSPWGCNKKRKATGSTAPPGSRLKYPAFAPRCHNWSNLCSVALWSRARRARKAVEQRALHDAGSYRLHVSA